VIVVDRRPGIRNGDCAAGRSRSLFFVFASERFGDAGERPGISEFAGQVSWGCRLRNEPKPEGLETLLEVIK
jgi:hypothetical protein